MTERYENMTYRRCGKSGLQLPLISMGCWHNFGELDDQSVARQILHRSFDLGITHFDLANNYGHPAIGSAESFVGQVLRQDFRAHRDELIISTKAGFRMWPGPYGDGGSRKYLLASLDQSLVRLGLDYVDIYYHHRFDSETPLEETAGALARAVHSGKALYAAISNYDGEQTKEMVRLLREERVPVVLNQSSYNLLQRHVEERGTLDACESTGIGLIGFCPLAQGLLTDKYLKGVPPDSRAAQRHSYLQEKRLTEDTITQLEKLNAIARERGETLVKMAYSWILRDPRVTSVLTGASKVEQVESSVEAILNARPFSDEELEKIDEALA